MILPLDPGSAPEAAMGDRRCYNFHGLQLLIAGDRAAITALDARLRHFRASESTAPDLHFDFRAIGVRGLSPYQAPPQARPVYESPLGQVLYDAAADRLFLIHEDRVSVVCEPDRGYAQIGILESTPPYCWLASHPFFTIPFIECLKRRSRYNLHAAGLCLAGKSLLFPASSGSGKSTLAITLARAGFGFLGDDMTFLMRGTDGVRVLAFPDEIDVTEHTAGLFPELHHLLDRPPSPGWHKRQFLIEAMYPAEVVGDCSPAALVFPRVAHADTSVLKRISRDEALLELAPNILLTSGTHAQAHLDILGDLVRSCACYRLETGRDFDALPDLLRGVIL